MPKFRHTYPYEKVYVLTGLRVQPDEVIEADKNPDPLNFEEVKDAPAKAAKSASSTTPDPKETD